MLKSYHKFDSSPKIFKYEIHNIQYIYFIASSLLYLCHSSISLRYRELCEESSDDIQALCTSSCRAFGQLAWERESARTGKAFAPTKLTNWRQLVKLLLKTKQCCCCRCRCLCRFRCRCHCTVCFIDAQI